MPIDVRFPRPAADRCPGCDGPFDGSRCGRCGLVLVGDDAAMLWRIDGELHRLSVQREEVLARLHAGGQAVEATPVVEGRSPALPPRPQFAPPPPPSPARLSLPAPPGRPLPPPPVWAGLDVTLPNLLLGL
ncbi:MAG TPA: hypothetical protein VFI47_06855, partial [Acidimicrobiales bacterium]|nr:hypothetical protein [Acidimicrobiales bacterium]